MTTQNTWQHRTHDNTEQRFFNRSTGPSAITLTKRGSHAHAHMHAHMTTQNTWQHRTHDNTDHMTTQNTWQHRTHDNTEQVFLIDLQVHQQQHSPRGVHTRMHTCTHACMHMHTHTHAHSLSHTFTHTRTHYIWRVYVHTCVCMRIIAIKWYLVLHHVSLIYIINMWNNII